MSVRKYKSEAQASKVAQEVVWLAWQACGGPQGMGFLQNNPEADKAAVIMQATGEKDYVMKHARGLDIHCDYVFGRMMKLYVTRPTPTEMRVDDHKPRSDYQSWCCVYKTYGELFDAAEKAVGVKSLEQAA